MNSKVLFSILLILVGCATTRVNELGPCATQLKPGNKILIPWLAKEDREFNLKQIKRIMQSREVDVRYISSEQYTLHAAGITLPVDSTHYDKLLNLGYTHLLLIKETDQHQDSKFNYYTTRELQLQETNAYNPLSNEQGNQSEVSLHLLPLGDPSADYRILAKNTIGGLIVLHDDKSETHVNPTDALAARSKAIKKATKLLLKKCQE